MSNQIVLGDPTAEPVVYTAKGNLLLSQLTFRHEWINNDHETTLVEEYRLGDELVRRSVHVMLKKASAEAVASAAALV